MKVAKCFRWEGAHRLPWHSGLCRHLHGHSYRLTVELSGTPDARGMVVDFHDVKGHLQPLISAWDHATLVAETDEALLAALQTLGSKHYVLPYDSTSENVARYAAEYLLQHGRAWLAEAGVDALTVRVQETDTCFAEHTCAVTVATPAMALPPKAVAPQPA